MTDHVFTMPEIARLFVPILTGMAHVKSIYDASKHNLSIVFNWQVSRLPGAWFLFLLSHRAFVQRASMAHSGMEWDVCGPLDLRYHQNFLNCCYHISDMQAKAGREP